MLGKELAGDKYVFLKAQLKEHILKFWHKKKISNLCHHHHHRETKLNVLLPLFGRKKQTEPQGSM